MAIPVNFRNFTAVYAIPTIVGGLVSAGVVHFGHSFVTFGYDVAHAGIFGALQAIVAGALRNNIKFTEDGVANYAVSQIIAGASLYGLSLVAMKVGLLASCLTLPGAALVIASTTVSSLLALMVTTTVQESIYPKEEKKEEEKKTT